MVKAVEAEPRNRNALRTSHWCRGRRIGRSDHMSARCGEDSDPDPSQLSCPTAGETDTSASSCPTTDAVYSKNHDREAADPVNIHVLSINIHPSSWLNESGHLIRGHWSQTDLPNRRNSRMVPRGWAKTRVDQRAKRMHAVPVPKHSPATRDACRRRGGV